jgi:hypothetical protein
MSSGLKLAHVAVAVAVCAAVYVAGVFFMVDKALENPPAMPPLAAIAPDAPPIPAPMPPMAEAAAEPAAPAPVAAPPAAVVPNNAPVVPATEWTLKTIFGLPAPRKLTAKEKAGLLMLGTADDTQGFEFNRMTLDDGSTIPGSPALSAQEVRERIAGPIKKLGLADGFEAAVIDLAPHSLHHLTIQTSETPDWAAVQAVVGKEESKFEGDIWLRLPNKKGTVYFRIAWFRYGWLEFGVGEGKVRVVKAEMRYADIVPAESIPGGRSAPDASKVKRKKQYRSPTEPAAEVDALKLLGRAVEVRIVRRSVGKDTKLDELVHSAQALTGKDIYPGAVEKSREMKSSIKVQYLSIVPSQNVPIEQIVDLLGDPFKTKADTTTIPGQALTWHLYHWLEFGTVDGKVVKVRVNCLMMPSLGL